MKVNERLMKHIPTFIIHSNKKKTQQLMYPEAYSERSQISKMKLFAKIVNNYQLLIIFAKSPILIV